MQILTPDLIEALKAARKHYPSAEAMAQKIGISGSMLSRILHGKVSHIKNDTWQRARKHININLCKHGYAMCPLNDCALKKLLNTILKINDSDTYHKIDALINRDFLNNTH